MLMRGFHLLVLMVIGDSVKDTQCGFKVGAFNSCVGVFVCRPGGGGAGGGDVL